MFFLDKQQNFEPLDKEILDTMLKECEKEMFSNIKQKKINNCYFAAEITHNARVGKSYPMNSLSVS